MYADSLENLFFNHIIDRLVFEENVQIEYIDMNHIPNNLYGKYDFCWSICALEHLGTIENGLSFVKKALDTLTKGGMAVHTTEYNLSEHGDTISKGNFVLYQKRHIESLIKDLRLMGYKVEEPDFNVGNGVFDCFIDTPPYLGDGYESGGPHIKLDLNGYVATSFGLIIHKPL